MGNGIFRKKKVIPLNNKYKIQEYQLQENQIITINNQKLVRSEEYIRLLRLYIDLKIKIDRMENSTFECIVCYNKDIGCKRKIRCNHDLCVNCYHMLIDKKCPLCRTKIK